MLGTGNIIFASTYSSIYGFDSGLFFIADKKNIACKSFEKIFEVDPVTGFCTRNEQT
jgi:hypothetical protein